MTEAQFSAVVTPLMVGGLVLYMAFIVYKLAAESKAGRWGTLVLFFVLGLGVLGFIAKEVLVHTLSP